MGLYGLDVGELVFEDPNTARSVLDGARLETRIASVRIASVPRTIEPVDSDAKVCTLLTTATALDSRTALKLPADRTIDTADGRRVYKFVRRNRVTDDAPVDDFAPEVSGALVPPSLNRKLNHLADSAKSKARQRDFT